MRRKKPTTADVLREVPKVVAYIKGPRPGTRITKTGSVTKHVTFNWPEAFARRFAAYCSARDLWFSKFAMEAAERAMADEVA